MKTFFCYKDIKLNAFKLQFVSLKYLQICRTKVGPDVLVYNKIFPIKKWTHEDFDFTDLHDFKTYNLRIRCFS